MFRDWFNLLKKLQDTHYSTENYICPECGERSIDYTYVGDPDTHIGYLPIWCNKCNKGIIMSRVKIPDQAKMITNDEMESGKKSIPNFKIISS